MVTRRTLSKLAGGVLLTGLAGCTGSTASATPDDGGGSGGTDPGTEGEDAEPKTDDPKTDDPKTDDAETDDNPTSFDPASVERVGAIPGSAGGEGSPEPHDVAVWNDAREARTIDLGVVPAGSGALGSATFRLELAADAAASVRLGAPDDYEVRIRLPERESPATVRIEAERFDCNASSTNVRIGPDGGVSSEVLTTLVACDAGPVTGVPGDDGE